MASSTPDISDYKSSYHRYDDSVKVIARREVHRVFKWLYKGGITYVGEYLQTIPGSMVHIERPDKKQLKEGTLPSEDMDIPLLYQVIKNTCGLSSVNTDWTDPEESKKDSIEYSLNRLKNKRNELSHEDDKLRKLPDSEMAVKMNEVGELCLNILTEAGNRSGHLQDAATAVIEMQKDLSRVMGFQPEHIATLGRQEKKKSNAGLDMRFYSLPLLYHKENTLLLKDLLGTKSEDGDRSSIIIIRGDAGMGKSTLCQYLDWLWINDGEDVSELQDYDLLLFIRCRDICTRDVIYLLREDLLPDTMRWCDPYKAPELLEDLRILWIMDGLDEATPEASDVLRKLIKKGNSNHTFLIASRPEYIHGITGNFQQQCTEVTIQGVDPKEVFHLMKESRDTNYSLSDLESFRADFEKLDADVKIELQNPSKLHIALQLWREAVKKIQMSSSLSQLYEALKNGHIQSLSDRLAKGAMTINDATRKVNDWFNYLCKVAFEMTADKEVLIISKEKLRMLERRSDELQMPAADCLSSFLANKGSGEYNFFHSTQQYSFAALHVASVFQSCNDKSEVLKLFKISRIDDDDKKLIHFYEVLLYLVSNLHEELAKSKAADLVQLLNCAIDKNNASPKWFEVVQKANYNKNFLVPISRVIPEMWFISDQNIMAAKRLLIYTRPKRVVLRLYTDPKNLNLEPLLRELSHGQSYIDVELYLNYHFRNLKSKEESNEFLKLICHEGSRCCILAFSGHLNLEGYKLLGIDSMNRYCILLQLKLTSLHCLSLLCDHIQNFPMVKNIGLIFAFSNYGSTKIKTPFALSNYNVDLNLTNLLDRQVERAVRLICSLSQNYNHIIVNRLPTDMALKLVSMLQVKVRAKAFMRQSIDEELKQNSLTNFGSIPFEFPISYFPQLWIQSETQSH